MQEARIVWASELHKLVKQQQQVTDKATSTSARSVMNAHVERVVLVQRNRLLPLHHSKACGLAYRPRKEAILDSTA